MSPSYPWLSCISRGGPVFSLPSRTAMRHWWMQMYCCSVWTIHTRSKNSKHISQIFISKLAKKNHLFSSRKRCQICRHSRTHRFVGEFYLGRWRFPICQHPHYNEPRWASLQAQHALWRLWRTSQAFEVDLARRNRATLRSGSDDKLFECHPKKARWSDF